MLNRPSSRQTSKRLIIGFPLILLLAATLVWQSIDSVREVTHRAQVLVERHIPELRAIAALQTAVNQYLLALHEYYATMEIAEAMHNGDLDKRISRHLGRLRSLGSYESEVAALEAQLDGFRTAANGFHGEMQLGPERDWDRLREFLAAASSYAALADRELQDWNSQLHSLAKKGGEQTMEGVARLNILQLVFALVVVFVVASLMALLYVRVRDQALLYHRAYHDELTDLPNRRSMEKTASELLRPGMDRGRKSIMWLSLDRIALVSGTYGYDLGDQLLRAFSKNLEQLLDDSPYGCCLFSFERANWVICVEEDEDFTNAAQLLSHIELFTQKPLAVDGRKFNIACSIGVAHFPVDGNSLIDILHKADTARREAVSAGGNTHRLYRQDMTREAELLLAVETALRGALQKDAFELHYQPKLNNGGNELRCAEALLRWSHEGEYISPARFIPVAEQTGLVKPIGEWVLQRACEQWVEWREQGYSIPPVAVNISAQQFQDADFPTLVQRILECTGMPPNMLELEITEEAANVRPEAVVETMCALKKIGVTLAIDDFGTGYSSLAYLKRFPLDVLKIDRAFVSQLDESGEDLAIVHMIVDMAHQLGFEVVAEGVETERQWQLLRDMQCDLLQGFLFSSPLDAEAYLAYANSLSSAARSEAM